MIIMLAMVDRNGAITSNGIQPYTLQHDMRVFSAATMDQCVVYGRKTLESFPGHKPLGLRRNIILSHNPDLKVDENYGPVQIIHDTQELFELAEEGNILPISSLCTVFAESEVINYIGEGKNREDIAAGVVDSVAAKVAQLSQRKELPEKIILTGGLSRSRYFTRQLSQKIGKTVEPTELGRYAGALGAAILAKEKSSKR